jgi:hypothetical protein
MHMIQVYDFNPHSVFLPIETRLVQHFLDRRLVVGPTRVTASHVFLNPVETCLPYVISARSVNSRCRGVMVDQERIIGYKSLVQGFFEHEEELDVFLL